MVSSPGPAAVVFVVDDDASVRDALTTLISAEGLEVRSFENASEFLTAYQPSHAGCLVTDIEMPGLSGLELQTHLRELGSELPVIVLTAFGNVSSAVRAMKAGAIDFVEKPYSPDFLLRRIHVALAVDEERRVARRDADDVRACLATLTPREKQVLEMVAQGSANKVVAIDLGISERTVELHRSKAMKKMKVRSVAELVARMVAAR